MCRGCGAQRSRERKPRKALFSVDCPECGTKAVAYGIYSCWCDWCGSFIDLKDGEVIGHRTEEQMSIRPSLALRSTIPSLVAGIDQDTKPPGGQDES